MASVSFGVLSKRINSTKQPASLSDQRTVVLKEQCSQDNPVFICTGNNFNYNYCQWDGKYYFIDDIISLRNNEIEIHCSLDVLATYKTDILNTTAYVIYDTVLNTQLPDNRLPMKTAATVDSSTAACPFVPDGGCYVVSLTGAHNSTGVYKMSPSELAALIDDVTDLTDNIFDYGPIPSSPSYPPAPASTGNVATDLVNSLIYLTTTFSDTADWLVNWIKWWTDAIKLPITQFMGTGNVPNNIRECKFIPFNVGTTSGSNLIYLGTVKTKQSLGKLNTETVHRTTSVSIPWQANDYRRRSPYTDIYLYLPYIGMVKLSSENLVGQSTINVSYTLGMRDGSLICTITSGSEVLGQYSCNVGASVPVGISNINMPKVAQSVLSGIASVVNTKNIGAIGMAAMNFGDSITPNFSCLGGLDGVAGIATNQNITCYTVFHDTIAAPNSEIQTIGSPSMCPKQLSNLTGFCQCSSAHVEAAATAVELAKIDEFINSGFFIE